MQGSNKKEWLIKSSGEIKGPYTFEEIAQGIASREFILVDEISKKFSRWKYLRDEEVFDRVVYEIKNKEYSRGEKTFTNSETDTLTEDLTEDLSKGKILNFQSGENLLSSIQEHLKENEQERITHQKTEARAKIDEELQVKNYAIESELKKQAASKNLFVRFAIIIAIIVGFGSLLLLSKKEKVLSYDDLKKIAYDNINYGNFEEAKIYLEKALNVNGTNEELKYLLSYVSVDLDDSITAQRLLEDLSKTGKDKKLKAQIFNLMGILQLKNFSLEGAKKKFDESLKYNPKYPAAFFNKGVAYYLENKFDLAYQNFTQSMVNGGLDGNILLAMVEWATRHGSALKTDPTKKKQAEDILSLLNKQSQNLYAYRQELKIAAAYMYFNLGDKDLMQKVLEDAINIDPMLTADHVQDVAFYKGLVTWDRMTVWIKKMRDANNTNETLRTLYGYALFKGSEKLKGKDIIEGLLKSDYSNTSNQIALSYILMTLKRDDDAKATLAPIMHNRDKSLSFVMMGKLCLLKSDYPCADLNFSEVVRIDKNNIVAQAGLADVYFEQKDYKKVKDLARQIFKLSPTYKPILSVKQKIEGLKDESN